MKEPGERAAAYARTWGHGWCTGQFEKAESIMAMLVGLHGKATTAEGKAALAAALKHIEAQHKRQFPGGRGQLVEKKGPKP
jgi:hypothetical protein